MKTLKFTIKIGDKYFFIKYKYQNLSFPLIVLSVYRFNFFGFYFMMIKPKYNSLKPKEVINWELLDFKKHAINCINVQNNISSDTNLGIQNFKKITETH